MPYINVKVLKGVTAEQKNKVIQGVTQVLYDVLDKNPASTYVVIDEVDTDNWGKGGQSMTENRKSAKQS